MYVTLKDKSQWRKHLGNQGDIVDEMSKDLQQFKGLVLWFKQPI